MWGELSWGELSLGRDVCNLPRHGLYVNSLLGLLLQLVLCRVAAVKRLPVHQP